MKDTIIEQKRTISYIITIIAVIAMVIGLGLMLYDYNLEQRAININATITSLDYQNGANKATVKYEVDRESYRQEITLSKDGYSVNDEVPIKYDINNPGQLINNNHFIIAASAIGISLVLLLFSLRSTIKNIKRSNNIKYLAKKGIYVEATISEVIVDNKLKKHKELFPYKLRAKYNNPIDNKIYTFDSEPTYIDLNAVIKKYNNQVVLVYLDKNNTNNFFVDLDSLFPHVKLVDVATMMGDKKAPKPTEGEETKKDENQSNIENTADSKEEQPKE